MTNELQVTGEVLEGQLVVSETEKFAVVQDPKTGKFSRKAKYQDYSSIVAESRAEKIWLLNLMNSDEESGTGKGLKDMVGQTIVMSDIMFRKYDKINEDTGATEYGVLTYILSPKVEGQEREVYVTSSKTVYFAIDEMLRLFGKPTDAIWEDIQLKVGKKKGTNGDIITVQMIG